MLCQKKQLKVCFSACSPDLCIHIRWRSLSLHSIPQKRIRKTRHGRCPSRYASIRSTTVSPLFTGLQEFRQRIDYNVNKESFFSYRIFRLIDCATPELGRAAKALRQQRHVGRLRHLQYATGFLMKRQRILHATDQLLARR